VIVNWGKRLKVIFSQDGNLSFGPRGMLGMSVFYDTQGSAPAKTKRLSFSIQLQIIDGVSGL